MQDPASVDTLHNYVSPPALIFLNWIRAPSSLFSLLGSLLIIAHVFRAGAKKSKTYQRIMVGLSFFDVVSSSSSLMFLFFFDPYHPQELGTVGCTASTFFQIIGVGCASFYTLSLSIMFALIIVFGMKDDTIAIHFEPYAHLVSISYTGVFAITGLFLSAYNPVQYQLECWANPYPNDCLTNEDEECLRGGEAAGRIEKWALFSFYPVLLTLIISNLMIYHKVQKTENQSQRFHNETMQTVISSGRRTRRVARQSFMYCSIFAMIYIPSIVLLPVNTTDNLGKWWWFILASVERISWPLQGFFDAVVYFSPRYRSWRRNCPNDGRWFAMKMATLSTVAPHPNRSRSKFTPARPRRHRQSLVKLEGENSAHISLDEGSATLCRESRSAEPPSPSQEAEGSCEDLPTPQDRSKQQNG